jgi:hypothetical protein
MVLILSRVRGKMHIFSLEPPQTSKALNALEEWVQRDTRLLRVYGPFIDA